MEKLNAVQVNLHIHIPMGPKLRNNSSTQPRQGQQSIIIHDYMAYELIVSFFIPDYQTYTISPIQPNFVPDILLSPCHHYTYTCKGYILMQISHLTHFLFKQLIFMLCYSCNFVHHKLQNRDQLGYFSSTSTGRRKKKIKYLFVCIQLFAVCYQHAISKVCKEGARPAT